MNSRSEARLNMYHAVQNHCDDENAIVSAIPAFAAGFEAFKAALNAIHELESKDADKAWVTSDKKGEKITLCKQAADIAAQLRGHGFVTANAQYIGEMDLSYSDLMNIGAVMLADRCQAIKDMAAAKISELSATILTEADLTAFQDRINAFRKKSPAPRNSKVDKKVIREKQVALMSKADKILKQQMDTFAVGFKKLDPDFYTGYKGNRSILDAAKSATTLRGLILDAASNSAVEDAVILVKETGSKVTVNKDGQFEIKPIPAGKYSISVSAPKYKERMMKEVSVKTGKITSLDFMLEIA